MHRDTGSWHKYLYVNNQNVCVCLLNNNHHENYCCQLPQRSICLNRSLVSAYAPVYLASGKQYVPPPPRNQQNLFPALGTPEVQTSLLYLQLLNCSIRELSKNVVVVLVNSAHQVKILPKICPNPFPHLPCLSMRAQQPSTFPRFPFYKTVNRVDHP